jgi:hypothetical protein
VGDASFVGVELLLECRDARFHVDDLADLEADLQDGAGRAQSRGRWGAGLLQLQQRADRLGGRGGEGGSRALEDVRLDGAELPG